ncbi:DUF1127 domain-containing protein [Oricola cellulosilytica]
MKRMAHCIVCMAALLKRALSNRLKPLSCKHNENEKTTEAAQPRKDLTMNLARSFNEWRRYNATRAQLNRLSSRELEDIGMNRGDITEVARKAARI